MRLIHNKMHKVSGSSCSKVLSILVFRNKTRKIANRFDCKPFFWLRQSLDCLDDLVHFHVSPNRLAVLHCFKNLLRFLAVIQQRRHRDKSPLMNRGRATPGWWPLMLVLPRFYKSQVNRPISGGSVIRFLQPPRSSACNCNNCPISAGSVVRLLHCWSRRGPESLCGFSSTWRYSIDFSILCCFKFWQFWQSGMPESCACRNESASSLITWSNREQRTQYSEVQTQRHFTGFIHSSIHESLDFVICWSMWWVSCVIRAWCFTPFSHTSEEEESREDQDTDNGW